jgi:orotate phosphoribosyltransferase-like protein
MTKRKKPFHDCASHLDPLINVDLLKVTVRNVIKAIKLLELENKFDAIAFRGLSGSLIAPVVALKLGKTLLAVRKGEECHSSRQVEGDLGADRYIIIDDFVSSGETVNKIRKAIIRRVKDFKARCTASPKSIDKLGKLEYIGVLQASRILFNDGKLSRADCVFIGAGTDNQW